MRNSFEKVLNETKIMIADGAMATELEGKGCDLNNALWSAVVLANTPQLIKEVHMDYFEAGADCGMSASYQATIPGFMNHGYTQAEAESLIKRAIDVLSEARDEWWDAKGKAEGRAYPIVSGAVGPYGAFLSDGSEYTGNYRISKDDLITFHKRRLEILWEAGADILAHETIPCLEEAIVLAEITQEIGAECWMSFSCKNETEISEGTKIAEAAKALEDFACVKAIGINCTAPEYVSSLIKEIKSVSSKAVIVYPNSGEDFDAVTKTWSGLASGKTYGDWAAEWIESGATIVGGCCRTTPANISEVFDIVKAMR